MSTHWKLETSRTSHPRRGVERQGRRAAGRCCRVAAPARPRTGGRRSTRAVVVDLPLVPVIATTRERSTSWSQRLSAEVTVTPLLLEVEDVSAATRDARALQDDVAAHERVEPARAGSRARRAPTVARRRRGRVVGDARQASPASRVPRRRSRRCPTRLPARSAKPVGRNTAGSLWSRAGPSRSRSVRVRSRECAEERDVATTRRIAADPRERDRALVGVADALERLVLDADARPACAAALRARDRSGARRRRSSRSAARERNGASTRLMKRHLSHSPHHVARTSCAAPGRRRDCSCERRGGTAFEVANSWATHSSLRSRRKLATTSSSPTRSAMALGDQVARRSRTCSTGG